MLKLVQFSKVMEVIRFEGYKNYEVEVYYRMNNNFGGHMKNYYKESSLKIIRFIEDGNSVTQEDNGQLINRAVISHIADIQNLTLNQLAEDTCLSNSAASRYFKRKGFPSFTSFKNAFTKFMMEQQIAIIRNSYETRDETEKIGRLLDDMNEGIINDADRSYAAAEIMKQCDHVVFVGEMYDIQPFFPLQVILICSSTAAYLCRTCEMDSFPDRIIKGSVAIVTVTHTKENIDSIIRLKEQLGDAKIISFGKDSSLPADAVIPSLENDRFIDRSIVIPMQVKCLTEVYMKVSGLRP